MRRSSIGLPLRPSNSPADFDDGDMPFDDDDMILDEGGHREESESLKSPSKQPQTPRRVGTSNVFQDDEDPSGPNPRSKGKTNSRKENQGGEDVEEEIAQGLQDVEMQQENEDEEVTPKKKPTEKRPRKKRVLVEVPRKKPFAMPRPSYSFSPLVSPENTSASGLRRGKRLRYEPLEWWRCEKVVYGRRDPGKKTYVPTIKEIVRIPKDEPKPLGIAAHKTKRGTSHRRKTTEEPATVDDPEEGWDEKTPTNGVVIDWFTGNEVSRRTLNISVEM
jgi:centromere protein C